MSQESKQSKQISEYDSSDDDSSVENWDESVEGKSLKAEIERLREQCLLTHQKTLELEKESRTLKIQNDEDMLKLQLFEEETEKIKAEALKFRRLREVLFIESLMSSFMLNADEHRQCKEIRDKAMCGLEGGVIWTESQIREEIMNHFKSIQIKLNMHEKQIYVKKTHREPRV